MAVVPKRQRAGAIERFRLPIDTASARFLHDACLLAWVGYAFRVVLKLSQHPLSRLFSMLSIALMFAFANASVANAVDHVQHQASVAGDHDHLPFSKIVFETCEQHHAHHSMHSNDCGDAPDHKPGIGHHHHVDSGSGLPAPLAQGSGWVFSEAQSWRPAADGRMCGFLIHGLERPPKSSAIRI